MRAPKNLSLAQHPAFQGLSEASQVELQQSTSYLRYQVGQLMSLPKELPSQVLLILEGEARLLGKEQTKPFTLGKLGPGAFVGLASLLRAAPCEEASASSAVLTAALPDDLVVRLYSHDPHFRQWCDHNLFPAEVYDLVQRLVQRSSRSDVPVKDAFLTLMGQAKLVAGEGGAGIEPTPERYLFVGSATLIDHQLGDQLDAPNQLPENRGPMGVRLVSLPKALIDDLDRLATQSLADARAPGGTNASHETGVTEGPAEETATEIPQAALLPGVSGADLGQYAAQSKFQLIRANGELHETLACFQMLARELELPFRRDSIEKILRDQLRRGMSPTMDLCGNLAAMLGLHVTSASVPASFGTRLQVPALVPWKGTFAIVRSSTARGLTLASPKDGWVELAPDEIEANFPEGIDVLLMDRSSGTQEQKFGLDWFLPSLKKYQSQLLLVLGASFVVQLFGLANPLLIQVIIDKVISQRSLDTLQILGLALVVVTLLEGVLGSLRTFLFTETTNRIDTRLGAEVIDHLLRLPLNYFDNRPVGELAGRISELEKIRNFLTGQALTTILDAGFSIIYIVVMVFYSWLLTIIALIVVPIQVVLTLIGAPLFRRQIRETTQENAKTQSHLVEVLTGIQTVKAQNVEMVSRWKWQDYYSKYIARTFEKTITGTALNETSQVLQKLSQLLVLWVGAILVLQGELTLGQLIAFRIISGYVTQPLLRLSSIWQNIQELRVSFERLADVVDTPQESNDSDRAKIPLPGVKGGVKFDDITFAFRAGAAPVLKNVDLEIAAGTFVGVVGQSGSGKSTLMKLLPRLYAPGKGRILIDGYDIEKVELYSLRRQIGIVPQDPLLFSGSVSENIALTDPNATSDAIVEAAKIACAHDFIMELPLGYSSNVGERGANLSGGQRQRIAIARTLISKPRLLVMDEATSALDYDTERRVCDNLRESLQGSTVFFITHRLSTVRNADLIVMMHQGAIVETGRHDALISQKGRYFALYRQQEAG